MLKLSDARNFRRTAAALALIAGPALLLVSSLLTTYGSDDTAQYVAEVAGRRGEEEASAVLAIFGFALLIPGVIGALNLLRGRGVVLGHLGGALAVLGLAFFCALLASSFYDVAGTAPGADTQAHIDTVERLDDRAGPIIVVAIALLGTLIGFILLGAAFIRAKTAAVWVGPLLIVGVIVVGPFGGESRALSIAGNMLLLWGFGTIGLQLLQQSDDEWSRQRSDPPPAPRSEPAP